MRGQGLERESRFVAGRVKEEEDMKECTVSAGTAGISDEVASYLRMQHINPKNNSAVQSCVQRVSGRFGEELSPDDVIGFLEAVRQDQEKKNGSSDRLKPQFFNHPRHRVCACRSGKSRGGRR